MSARIVFQGIYDLLVKIGLHRGTAIKMLSFIFLPGTIIHELSHMLMAESLRVRTGAFTVWPQEEEGHIKLGSVRVERCDPLRAFLIGIAPIVVGILVVLAFFVALYEAASLNLTPFYYVGIVIVGGYSIFVTANTMFSSRRDIEACLEFILLFLIFGVVSYFLWDQYLGSIIHFLMNEQIAGILSDMNKILLIPLGMNGVVVLIRLIVGKNKRVVRP